MGPQKGGRSVNGKHKTKKYCKVHTRGKFLERHIDQVWQDVRKAATEVHEPGKMGPMGNTSKMTMDEDVPGYGKYYCIPCSRYFQSGSAQVEHEKTKAHKRRVKLLVTSAQPHNQQDADVAAGMGKPDNGPKLRSSLMMD